MHTLVRKLHVITTGIAVSLVFLALVLFFLHSLNEYPFRLDLFPNRVSQWLNNLNGIVAFFAVGFGAISVMLSLFRKAERE